jgi:hypothetical protein
MADDKRSPLAVPSTLPAAFPLAPLNLILIGTARSVAVARSVLVPLMRGPIMPEGFTKDTGFARPSTFRAR